MSKKRILVIEDEKELSDMLKLRFVNAGYEVEQAFNGEEGLAKAKKIKPDLITLDIKMPRINGYEVCKALKNNKKYSHIPIIMLSVRYTGEEKEEGLSAGADDYMGKPYDAERLLGKVGELLREG